jgi:hypothetical protein
LVAGVRNLPIAPTIRFEIPIVEFAEGQRWGFRSWSNVADFGVLDGGGAIEDGVAGDELAGGAGGHQNAHSRFMQGVGSR